jgi:adenylate cyclase
MALAQGVLRFHHARANDGGLAAAERAIALDENLAEAHAARAQVLIRDGDHDEAWREVEAALSVDPESYEANHAMASWYYTMRRQGDAIPYYEKAATVMENDYNTAGMVISCYNAIGNREGARLAARRALERVERIVAQDPDNGSAISFGVGALAALGEHERAREWMERAMLLDPDNINMRYNFACMLVTEMRDFEAALDMLEPGFARIPADALRWTKSDPDLDPIRDHPRFKAMLEAAEKRLALVSPGNQS